MCNAYWVTAKASPKNVLVVHRGIGFLGYSPVRVLWQINLYSGDSIFNYSWESGKFDSSFIDLLATQLTTHTLKYTSQPLPWRHKLKVEIY